MINGCYQLQDNIPGKQFSDSFKNHLLLSTSIWWHLSHLIVLRNYEPSHLCKDECRFSYFYKFLISCVKFSKPVGECFCPCIHAPAQICTANRDHNPLPGKRLWKRCQQQMRNKCQVHSSMELDIQISS